MPKKFDLTDVPDAATYYKAFLKDTRVSERFIETSFGKVHAYCAGEGAPVTIVAMHGDGAKSSNFAWLTTIVPFIEQANVAMYSLSMPGYG